MHIQVGPDNMVESISFPGPLCHLRCPSTMTADHESQARQWMKEGAALASAIVISEPVAEEHADDPEFIHQKHLLCISEVEEEARRRMVNRYYSDSELKAIFQAEGYPQTQYNWKDDDPGPSFRIQIEDALFRSQELASIPEIARQYLEEARYREDDSGEIVRLRGKALREAMGNRRKELFRPRIRTKYDRVYAMPPPFDEWSGHNLWQQWYFIEKSDEVLWTWGDSTSSGMREQHGRYAHAFAAYERIGRLLSTWCFLYDRHNRMFLTHEFSSFYAIAYDLTGNYPVDWKQTQHLFKGKLLTLDASTHQLLALDL